MSIYILPALIALTIKLFVLMFSVKGQGQSKVFISMVLVLAVHNLCEALGFVNFSQGASEEYILRTYYTAGFWVAVVMMMYSMEVSHISIKYLREAVFFGAVVLTVSVLFTNSIIAGSESIGHIMTVVKGDYYWVFRAFSLSVLAMVVPMLVIGYRRAEEHIVEIQCIYTFLAMLPIVIVVAGVIILMSFGVKINAAAIFPVASTLFLLITLKSESKHRLSDVRRFIPNSVERQTTAQVMGIMSRYSRDEMTYREGISEIEKLLVMQKYEKSGSNASVTAQLMGMPRSSLYSIFNRLKIETKD